MISFLAETRNRHTDTDTARERQGAQGTQDPQDPDLEIWEMGNIDQTGTWQQPASGRKEMLLGTHGRAVGSRADLGSPSDTSKINGATGPSLTHPAMREPRACSSRFVRLAQAAESNRQVLLRPRWVLHGARYGRGRVGQTGQRHVHPGCRESRQSHHSSL